MSTYQKRLIPTKSAWDKKSYDPISQIYRLKKEWPEWLDNCFFENYFSLKHWIKDLFSFFIKLYKWIPIIWKDRDYDDYFIFEILKKKIHQQRDYLVKNNRHTNISDDNHWMTVCLNLIERVQNNYYELEYFDYFDYDVEFILSEDNSGTYEMKQTTKRDEMIDYINKYPLTRNKTIEYLKNKLDTDVSDYLTNKESRHRLCLFMSMNRHKKAINVLFLVLANKIEHWWD